MNSILMTKARTGLHFFNILQLLFPLLVMESLRRMRRCAHVAWFALGICLAILISWILKRRECKDSDSKKGCILREESVRQQVCHANNTSNTASVETSSSSLMAVLFSLSGALIGIIGIALIVAVAIHLHEKRHGSYRRLIKSALLHQTRCHASVPEKRQNWKPLRWQASVSCKDLRKILCLDLDMVNISGVGLTLYRATMVLFLATAVLCRVGNDISERFFVYISADWCTDRLSPDQAATLWRDLAEERALALTRLYIIISLLHLYHLYRQGGRRDDFDRLHAEMSDYAYLASGFPESASQKDIMEYFSRSLRSFNVEGRIRWRPEIIGISIGYDYRANLKLVQNLVEEHLIDVAARLQSFEAPEFSESSGSDSESETSMNSMPVSLAQQRINALEMMGHDTGDNVLEVLRSLPNSGTVVVVWRWPCESVEILEEMQECLDNNQWEGADGTRRIQVMPIPCEPPSMIWTNFAAHLFERPGKEAAFFCSEKKLFLTGRQKQILVANVLIVSAFVIMLVFYYFLYKMVYGKGRHPEQILTTIVTCCCAVGNVLLNQLVWFASQQVGYRVKTHCDAFVLTWYALVVFTNMGFNFFVICWTAGSVPQDPLAAIQYESELGSRLVAFLRGSLISYAIWPLYYLFYWLKGLAHVLYLHLSRERAGLSERRCKWLAEGVSEPPEWYMQYDYAGIVVLEATSFMCLFVFGFDSWRVFSWDIMWACGIYFLNKYIYLAMSKETFYTSRTLDTSVLELMSMALGVLGGCVCHWGFRAGHPTVYIISVAIISVLYLWAFDRILQSAGSQRALSERVWYDDLPYEQLERMYPFNWFNVNPVHMMRLLHGVDQREPSCHHQQVVWQHGRSYLQPDLCFAYGEGREEGGDTDSEHRDIAPSTAFALSEAHLKVEKIHRDKWMKVESSILKQNIPGKCVDQLSSFLMLYDIYVYDFNQFHSCDVNICYILICNNIDMFLSDIFGLSRHRGHLRKLTLKQGE